MSSREPCAWQAYIEMGMSTNKALVAIICLDNQYANGNTFVIIVLFFYEVRMC